MNNVLYSDIYFSIYFSLVLLPSQLLIEPSNYLKWVTGLKGLSDAGERGSSPRENGKLHVQNVGEIIAEKSLQ